MARRNGITIPQLLSMIQQNPEYWAPALGKGSAGRTAQAATYLNYAPQFDTLAALLGTAREARRTGVQSARKSGLAGAQGITRIRDSYVQGLGDTLGTLGGPVAPNAPAASPEARAAQQLGLSGQALAGMLSGMAAQSVAGIGNQTGQLRRQYQSSLGEVGSKLGSLLQGATAYNTQQFTTLAGENAKARREAAEAQQRMRIDLMTAGINPDTGQYDPSLDAPKEPKADPINAYGVPKSEWEAMSRSERAKAARDWKVNTSADKGKDGKPKRDWLTQTQHNALNQKIDYIRSPKVKGLFDPNEDSRAEMVEVLRNGISNADAGVKDPATGKPAKGWYVEPVEDDLAIATALDMIQFGFVSTSTAKRLRQRGYQVKGLGLPKTPKSPYSGRT